MTAGVSTPNARVRVRHIRRRARTLARPSKYSWSSETPSTVPFSAASAVIPAATAALTSATALAAAKPSSWAIEPPASCTTRPLAMKKDASG